MSGDEQTEVSVAEAYCVVYTLSNKEWKVTGEGWAQVHLYRDIQDDTYRIVGWTVNDSEVVINSNVTFACKYKKKSADFHKFVDEEDRTFGFGFYKKDDSFEESDKFMAAITNVIAKESAPEMTETGSPAVGQGVRMEGVKQHTIQTDKVEKNKSSVLGKLQIMAAKPGRHMQIVSGGSGRKKKEMIISDPFSIEHKDHVEFNLETRTFVGLPDEWEASLNRQFGLPLSQVPSTKIEGYVSKIPDVLVLMKEYFLKNDGLITEGVLRIAPDSEESSHVKHLLNRGKFKACNDIHCMPHLIKLFFRELPGSILKDISPEIIIECKTAETASEVLDSLQEPNASVFRWLLDVCILIAENTKSNKMTDQAIAIVIAPNIFEGLQMAITLQLVFAPKAASFLQLAFIARRKERT